MGLPPPFRVATGRAGEGVAFGPLGAVGVAVYAASAGEVAGQASADHGSALLSAQCAQVGQGFVVLFELGDLLGQVWRERRLAFRELQRQRALLR